jgi:hypothetical protein
MKPLNYGLILFLSLVLTACGSDGSDGGDEPGGYSGKTSAATVNDDNSDDIGTGVHIAAKKSIESEESGGLLRSSGQSPLPAILEPLYENAEAGLSARSVSRNVSGSEDNSDFCTSGSASYEYNYADDFESGSASYSYNNCTYSYSFGGTSQSITYNGSFSYEFAPGYWLWDYNLTVTSNYDGETDQYTIKGTNECRGDGDTWDFADCTYSESYSEGGVSYRVSDVTFTSTGSSYDFTARVYHSDYGYVDVVATDLVYDCAGGGFSSGTITVSDSESNDVLSISYNGCDDPAVVTYQGATFNVSQ